MKWIKKFVIASKCNLYFKGFDKKGNAEFTLSVNKAKKYSCKNVDKFLDDFKCVQEQCYISDCRIYPYKTEMHYPLKTERGQNNDIQQC